MAEWKGQHKESSSAWCTVVVWGGCGKTSGRQSTHPVSKDIAGKRACTRKPGARGSKFYSVPVLRLGQSLDLTILICKMGMSD